MNNGVVQMRRLLDSQALDMQIAKQCAPLLTGIKISNILKTHITNSELVYEIFKDTVVKIKCIYCDGERITMLLYKPEALNFSINKPGVNQLMAGFGYKNMELEEILDCFTCRFTAFMKDRSLFPHEIGILLGYPIADVMGFIENEGKKYLYLGYWKVYSNLQGALDTFYQYKCAKEIVTHLVTSGMSINGILEEYQLRDRRMSEKQLVAV